jgi:hypothetical protein
MESSENPLRIASSEIEEIWRLIGLVLIVVAVTMFLRVFGLGADILD